MACKTTLDHTADGLGLAIAPVSSASGRRPLGLVPRHDPELAYAVPVDLGIGRPRKMKRVAAAYAGLLAGFHAFTLRRYVDGPGVIRELAVYRGDAPGEVGQLRRLLAAHPSDLHCMCIGSASISLEGGPTPAVLSVHHGDSVRWLDTRYGDFFLERGRELAEWMAARGVADVRDEMDESERERARSDAEERSWVAAMPESLLGYREAMLELSRIGGSPSPELLRQLSQGLADGESDEERRIRALLSWHAGGSGRCSGYPVHECVPEELLLAETPGALLTVVSAPGLTATETAGAARLVASWPAPRHAELSSLPPAAWNRLTAAIADGDDQDKRDRLARRRAESDGCPRA
jgi:hypothetical protein